MIGWVITVAFFVLVFWRIKRGNEKAAELAASGELRSPLFWTGAVLAMSTLALSMYMAGLKPVPTELWLLALALFVATLLVRRALKWRFPH
jgi:hypothetical protein